MVAAQKIFHPIELNTNKQVTMDALLPISDIQ